MSQPPHNRPPTALPAYAPPAAHRAALAAGLAPLLVLATFTLIVSGLMAVDTGMAVFAAATLWVVWELHEFQRCIDAYNHDYADRHLAWRSTATLQHWLQHGGSEPGEAATREFVSRYLAADRAVLRDGQLP
jgi:hypothetical protein